MSNKNAKLIQINKETYHKLVALGKYGDTIDSILSRVLEQNIKLENQEFPDKRQ